MELTFLLTCAYSECDS